MRVNNEGAAHGAERRRAEVRERPGSAASHYALGVALVRSGRVEEAEAAKEGHGFECLGRKHGHVARFPEGSA